MNYAKGIVFNPPEGNREEQGENSPELFSWQLSTKQLLIYEKFVLKLFGLGLPEIFS